jgi:hypothetical protein
VRVCNAPEKLQPELTELQYDSILYSSFNQEALITFYDTLPVSQYFQFHKFAQNLVAHVGHMTRFCHV